MPAGNRSPAPTGKRSQKGNGSPEPIPEVDESVRREARAVGLVAVLFAAGISAQALYSLGLLIGISPWTAWMLPGAMDLYAFESTRVASRVPARHPSRPWAVWNARLALLFTVAGNALFHALHLASGHHGWTNTDVALTAVSAVPPVIVERFLHLQTKINAVVRTDAQGGDARTGQPAAEDVARTEDLAPPIAPEAATQRTETKPATRNERTVRAPAPRVSRLTPHDERTRIIRGLIAQHGADNVTGKMVGDALDVDRSNGYRALQRALKEIAAKPEQPADAGTEDEPERTQVAS